MTIYLDEDWLGVADDIVYPNLQSCVALAVESSNANLGGMHMTINTKSITMHRAGTILIGTLAGPIRRVLCVGNLSSFKGGTQRDVGMLYKQGLAKTLHKSLDWTGPIYGYDTSSMYANAGGGANNGLVAHFWRALGAANASIAVGPPSAWANAGRGLINDPVFTAKGQLDLHPKDRQDTFDQVSIRPMSGKQGNIYTVQNANLQVLNDGDFRTF